MLTVAAGVEVEEEESALVVVGKASAVKIQGTDRLAKHGGSNPGLITRRCRDGLS